MECVRLLDVLYIAAWIMHAFDIEDWVKTKEYRDLEQKFYSLAKEFGVDDLVEPESGTGEEFIKKYYVNSLVYLPL